MGEALVKVEDRLGWVVGSREVGWQWPSLNRVGGRCSVAPGTYLAEDYLDWLHPIET
jgi:hypothetical protein